jgi:hypothetical protein
MKNAVPGKRQEPTRAPRENGPRTEEGRIPSDHTGAAAAKDCLNLTLRIPECFRLCCMNFCLVGGICGSLDRVEWYREVGAGRRLFS